MGPRTMLSQEQTIYVYTVQKRVQYYYNFIKTPNFKQQLLSEKIIESGCINVYLWKLKQSI